MADGLLALLPDTARREIRSAISRARAEAHSSYAMAPNSYGAGYDAGEVSGMGRILGILEARRCRVCGCSEMDCGDCYARTGGPCHWVEADLCSACVEPST